MKTVQYRRKKEGRTNYQKRLHLLMSRKHRIVVRKSLRALLVQVVDYDEDGDKVILSVHSRDLKKYGIPYFNNNISIAYLTGFLCGKRAISNKINEGIIDFGLQRAQPKGKLMAVVKGLVDAGMNIPHNPESLPDDSRIKGEHIVQYSSSTKDTKLFSSYASAKVDLSKFSEMVEQAKLKINKND